MNKHRVVIADNIWKLVEEYKYDEFGKAYTRAGKSDNWKVLKKSEIGNVRLFTGREYDKEIGLYYYRARYYSADLGRFISRDPIGTADNVNLYSYVGNSPVMYVDGMGLEKTLIFWGEDYLSNELTRLWWPDNFKLKAEAYRDYLISLWGEASNIIIANGSTFSGWQDALKGTMNIGKIVYYGHSWDGNLYLRDGTPNDASDNHIANLESLQPSNWTDSILQTHYQDGTRDHNIGELYTGNAIGAEISIYWCNSASTAKDFAKSFHWLGIWSTTSIGYYSNTLFWTAFIPHTTSDLLWNTTGWETYDYRN
ncbi:MAG: Wall associated protein [uncultured bacterium (gcode 4)]|uniref:Wall associated protein n=1 Tax=uncultured bacterium (gcode 4) TaxID=1234023 RepID=K1ZIS8_9BACT|nr:MAG: Wall associated protein [uncultured bacterium (gcode 4)]